MIYFGSFLTAIENKLSVQKQAHRQATEPAACFNAVCVCMQRVTENRIKENINKNWKMKFYKIENRNKHRT